MKYPKCPECGGVLVKQSRCFGKFKWLQCTTDDCEYEKRLERVGK